MDRSALPSTKPWCGLSAGSAQSNADDQFGLYRRPLGGVSVFHDYKAGLWVFRMFSKILRLCLLNALALIDIDADRTPFPALDLFQPFDAVT